MRLTSNNNNNNGQVTASQKPPLQLSLNSKHIGSICRETMVVVWQSGVVIACTAIPYIVPDLYKKWASFSGAHNPAPLSQALQFTLRIWNEGSCSFLLVHTSLRHFWLYTKCPTVVCACVGPWGTQEASPATAWGQISILPYEQQEVVPNWIGVGRLQGYRPAPSHHWCMEQGSTPEEPICPITKDDAECTAVGEIVPPGSSP